MTDDDPFFTPGDGEPAVAVPPPVPPEAIGQGADAESAMQQAEREAQEAAEAARRSAATAHPPDLERQRFTAPQPRNTARQHRAPESVLASRDLPHSEEAEQHVLACCLLDEGATLSRAVAAGLSPTSFYDPRARTIFATLLSQQARSLPVTLEVLASELGPRLPEIGGFPYLMQVTSGVPTTAHAGYFIERVRELGERRRLIREATGAIEAAYDGVSGDELGERVRILRARLDAVASPSRVNETEVAAALDLRRVRYTTPPKEPVTRLFLAGKPIATPGNLVTVIAKSKTGKTASLGAAVAAIIGAHYDRQGLDTFKFTAPHTKEAVILIDTEQSPYDAWTCHQRAMRRAGVADPQPGEPPGDPDWLHYYALVGMSAKELRDTLPVALARGRATAGGVFTLILDGVADFVASVNDEAECNDFIAYLRKLAVEFDCPVICVIHSNEGIKTGDDGRGHLGKQLTRKAESNLLLKKVGEVTTITSEKQRKAPITEADGVAFQWSDEHQRHISCAGPTPAKRGRKVEHDFDDFAAFFPGPDELHKPLSEIFRAAESTGIKRDSFNRMVERERQVGRLERLIDPVRGPRYRLV